MPFWRLTILDYRQVSETRQFKRSCKSRIGLAHMAADLSPPVKQQAQGCARTLELDDKRIFRITFFTLVAAFSE